MTAGAADWSDTAPAEARRLLRAARSGTLATVMDGQPFASLVTPAVAADGAVLLLLSGLSEHTRHLAVTPRCSLLVLGDADGPNPQTTPRLTVTGQAARDPDPQHRARWLARHPYAAFYAGLADFGLWRIEPEAGLLIGGFGRAARLAAAYLVPDAAVAAVLAPLAPALIEDWNARHAGGHRRLLAIDPDGAEFDRDGLWQRIEFPSPLHDATQAHAALRDLPP